MTPVRRRGVLLDTCALIDLMGRRPLSAEALARIAEADQELGVFVSPVSAWEVGLLARPRAKRPPVVFEPDVASWFEKALRWPGMQVAPLTCGIALRSATLPEPLHADPADRMLISTAREMAVDIVTSDRLILAYGAAGHVGVVAC